MTMKEQATTGQAAKISKRGPARRRPGLRPADRGAATRRKILDAAEKLFADLGYHGVTLRDIAGRARVNSSLATYHFRTKEQVFTAVVERRAETLGKDLLAALDAARQAAAPGVPGNRELVRAYALPAIEKIARGRGWPAYVKLVVGLQNLGPEETASRLANRFFDEVILRFIEAFIAANPALPPRRVVHAVYFLHGALIQILSQGSGFTRLVDGALAPDGGHATIEELARFFEAGLGDRRS